MRDYPSQRAVGAALFLLAQQYFPQWDGWPESEAEIFLLAGVSRSEAYEAREDLLDRLYDFLFDPNEPQEADPLASEFAVREAVLDYARNNLLAVVPRKTKKGRRAYSDEFCRFLVGLLAKGQPGEGMSLEKLAIVVDIPLYALQEWLEAQSR